MKKKKFGWSLILIPLFLISFIFVGLVFSQSSDNYKIELDVFSGGGGDLSSTSYDLFSLMGQPSAIGTSSSSSYRNYAGFIWALVGAPTIIFCEGDFDLDGDVDGSDLALFAHDFGRMDCSSSNPCDGDFNSDGKVDKSDLVVFAANFGRTDCPQ